MQNFNEKVDFIWKIAQLLRGPYKPEKYGNIILPIAIIRRFDCVLKDVLNENINYKISNKSKFNFNKLLDDPDNVKVNFEEYLKGFSTSIREIIESFEFKKEIKKLDNNKLLFPIIKEFAQIDLHPKVVSNQEMGYIFEQLIRKFSENAEAGDHYTPKEVIELMVKLIFNNMEEELIIPNNIITLGDFACGTGGMFSVATNYIKKINPTAKVEVFGQELNPQSYAICRSDILIKGQQEKNIAFGNSLTNDAHSNQKVRFALMNPPFGVDWKKDKDFINKEVKQLGFDGRFGAGIPRTLDGSFLFLQHMVSKMMDDEKGSKMAIIFNGSPLITGDATSGESEIRRWIIESDLLEGIISLPNDLFYNTGIATYIWILSNRKNSNAINGPIRKGKIQLVDASNFYNKMRKSLGSKRNEINKDDIEKIAKIYSEFKENEYCKIFDNKKFGYLKITVERPLKLNFKISEKRIQKLYKESEFTKLYDKEDMLQKNIIETLKNNTSDKVIKNRDVFNKMLTDMLKHLNLSNVLYKTIIMALSERDNSADYCMKRKKKEADITLRDTEIIPLSVKVDEFNIKTKEHVDKEKHNIMEYVEKEVKPYVDEFWVDESKTKIGYEIPFKKYFYKYKKLNSFKNIMNEIEGLEKEIQLEIKKVIE